MLGIIKNILQVDGDYEIAECMHHSKPIEFEITDLPHTLMCIHSEGGEGQGDHIELTIMLLENSHLEKFNALRKMANSGGLADLGAYVSFLETTPLLVHTFTGYYESNMGSDWSVGDNYEAVLEITHSISY